MQEIEFPSGDTPAAAIAWFKLWTRANDESELVIRASSAVGRVVPTVLVVSCARDRGVRALKTEVEINGDWNAAVSMLAQDLVQRTDVVRDRGPTLVWANTYDLLSARRAADQVADALVAKSPALSPSVVRMVRFVFEELGANVVQHSAAPRTGIGWADIDTQTRRFTMSFADAGVGIRASLQRNPELAGRIADDAEALQLALSPRISGTGASRSNMGWGLKALVDLSDLLNAELYIASGTAMLTRRSSAGQRTNVIREIPEWRGCWIALEAQIS